MSCVFLAAMHMDGFRHGLRGILFRFPGVASPKSELRMTFYERLCLVYSHLCIRMARRYGQGMTTTIMYIIQLFIHKKTRLSTKVKNQMYNL